MISSTYTISYKQDKKRYNSVSLQSIPHMPIAHRLLWLVCITLLMLYGYCIVSSIRNGMVAEKVQTRLVSLKKDMINLEYSYMSLADNIDLREAYVRGFVDSKNPLFVNAGALPTLSLSR